MKLGVFSPALQDKTLEEALTWLENKGVQAIELGCGQYPGKHHCNPEELLADEAKLQAFQDTFARHNIIISALSAHGNPLHPDKEFARKSDEDITNAILLAEKLGVDVVNGFSGCPGSDPDAKLPNWVTCAWPEDYQQVLEYQWNECLIPYWKEKVAFMREHNVHKFGFEMHPGFCVYNPATLLKLREAVGPELGANYDPSHLIWQGIDPVASIRELGRHQAIFHFHAKDTKIDDINTAVNGVLDTGNYGKELERSWIFRAVGYGHDQLYWKDMMTALRLAGYDYVISIEHEDSLMSFEEGISKSIKCLNEVMMFEDRGVMFWA